jgi:NAD(P)-dependent dehydrogenase (short-subunit alcohol dehydrogenase family)
MQASEMKGKAAMVTGAAEYLGRATALRLAKAGADVCLVDTDLSGLEETARTVRGLGVKAEIQAAAITARRSCFDVVERAVDAFGRLDAVCNVANAFRPSRSIEASQDDWELSLAINLSAPFYLTQAALPQLLKTEGAVVTVISGVAVLAEPYTAAYTASKAGVTQMMKSLAKEFIGEKVRINLVSFGGAAMNPAAKQSIPSNLDPKLFQRFSPVRPRIEIEKVADVVAFLVSDAASGFHGTCVTLDNGVSLG